MGVFLEFGSKVRCTWQQNAPLIQIVIIPQQKFHRKLHEVLHEVYTKSENRKESRV